METKKLVFRNRLLSPVSLGVAGGSIAGASLFFMTLISSATGYARSILELTSSIYPGYSVSIAGAFIGLAYAFVDAFIVLFLVSLVYNHLEVRQHKKIIDKT